MENENFSLKKQKQRAAIKKWRKNHPEKKREYEKRHYHSHPEWAQKRTLRHLHKMTMDEWQARLANQNYRCAICQTIYPGGRDSQWHLDHNHACPNHSPRKSCPKCWRALLCSRCNLALGNANDDPTLLRKMADYIEKYLDNGGKPVIDFKSRMEGKIE